MAELIPLEHRIRIARAALLRKWAFLLVLTAGASTVWLLKTYLERRRDAADYAQVAQRYQTKSVYLQEHADLCTRRTDLAARMKRIEDIQGDKLLLSLLSTASSSFGESDALDFVYVEAHNVEKKPEESRYSVRVRGFTADDTSYSHLLDRLTSLGSSAEFPIVVPLPEKHVSKMLDGEVTTFDITGNQPDVRGG